MAGPVFLRFSLLAFLGLTIASCAEDPWTYPRRPQKSVGAEVFRVFCKRSVRASTPHDLEGTSFDSACLGEGDLPEPDAKVMEDDGLAGERDRLEALVQRREKVVKVVDRILGDDAVEQKKLVTVLETDELRNFLSDLIPLYDKPQEELPGTTRTLSTVLHRLVDEEDKTGNEILNALEQVNGRQGYRKLDLALGVLRPLLEYPELDAFAENGLKAIAHGGVAEKALDEMSVGLALEMANYDPTPPEPDSTLIVGRDLLLSPIDQRDQPEREPIYITKRDRRGVAIPFGATGQGLPLPFADTDGDGLADTDSHGRFLGAEGLELVYLPGPYRVPGEPKGTKRDELGRALSEWNDDQQLYVDFDAQPTFAAALLRETQRLATPLKKGDRTPLEKFGRGLSALFGLNTKRTGTYGKAKISFDGPDPATSALHDVIYAAAMAVRSNPDAVRRFIQMFEKAMVEHEPEMAAFVEMALRVNERSKSHPEAKLVGEQEAEGPNRFWDDAIAIMVRASKREGQLADLAKMVTEPATVNLGQLVANWMEFSDLAPYKNADFASGGPLDVFTAEQEADLNFTPVETEYRTQVDRSQPSIGPNRSVFQQVMSFVDVLNQSLCNKKGTELKFVYSRNGAGLLRELGIKLPLSGTGYEKCDLFQVPHMVQLWVRCILLDRSKQDDPLQKCRINLKPDYLQFFDLVGIENTGEVQELESQIHDFHGDHPTPESLTRFLYGPPNQFTKALINPVGVDGKYGMPSPEIDRYGMYHLEVRHANAGNMNFLEAGRPLMEAFEKHQSNDPLTDVPVDGHLFSDLLGVFHRHWSSRHDDPCPTGRPACTQHFDPKKPVFSYQTDLRSYEPLLIGALREDRMVEITSNAAKAWQKITIDGKDGLTIFAELVEALVKPVKGLTYRDGTASAKNNLGEDVGYVSPLYLLLDGLKHIDQSFGAAEYAGRHEVWKEARSEIVDLFLTIEGEPGKQRLKDRVGRSIFVRTLGFLGDRIKAHQDEGDVEDWTTDLAPRAVSFVDTPLIAGLLHLFDQSWDEPAAGRELMRFVAYMVNERDNPVGFEATLVAVVDLLQLLENSQQVAPILDLASEVATPGVQAAVDEKGGSDFDPKKGLLRRLVELQSHLLKVHQRRPSTLSRVAGNLVRSERDEDQTPLEALIDVIAEVEREDATKPATALLEARDFRLVAKTLHDFLADDGHGVERLYAVIQNRTLALQNDQDQQ